MDTEWSEFISVRGEYRRLGLEYGLDQFRHKVGRADHLPWHEELQAVIGVQSNIDEIIARKQQVHHAQIAATGLRDGVIDVIEGAEQRRLRLAVASSSPHHWIDSHLADRGLHHRFSALASRDLVDQAKPWPDVFLAAAEMLSVEPASCLVIEDSQHGVTAAKQAGMTCVVVPNRATEGSDFSQADLVLGSLSEFSFAHFGL